MEPYNYLQTLNKTIIIAAIFKIKILSLKFETIQLSVNLPSLRTSPVAP